MKKQRPLNYWKSLDNVIREIKTLIGSTEEFPTHAQIHNLSGGLSGGIRKYHGGLSKVREIMGYEPRKTREYWEDLKNIEKELMPFIKKEGVFPEGKIIAEENRALMRAIHFYHGGLHKVAHKMGFELKMKPSGYWKVKKNLMREIIPIIRRLGHFPSQREVRKIGRHDLASVIIKYYRGFNGLRKSMGYKIEKFENGYWQDPDNFKRQLKNLTKELGHFPTPKELDERGKSSLYVAMKSYYGGVRKVKEMLGYKCNKPPKYWHNINNIIREIKQVINETGNFPTQQFLRSRNLSGLVSAIDTHHGGINSIKKRMGYEIETKPKGYWRKRDNVVNELKLLIKRLGHFPTPKEINSVVLKGAIYGYHGGFDKVREIMGYAKIEKKQNNTQQLTELLNTEPKARFALENVVQFADPDQLEVTIADIMSVVWDGRVTRDDLLKMLEEPSLKRYIGEFVRSKGGLSELPSMVESASNLLKYDKNGVIKDLIKRRIENWFYDGSLGPNPSYKEISASINYLKKQKEGLK